jgi:hypothetical protein
MPKFIPTKLPSMLKKLRKHKSPGSQSSLSSLVQQRPSGTTTPIPTPSLASHPLTDLSTIEAASLIASNIATSVAAPISSNAIPSRLETTPAIGSVAKDTAVNALKLLLKISSDIPGPGVKPALAGLLTIIERVQVRWRSI